MALKHRSVRFEDRLGVARPARSVRDRNLAQGVHFVVEEIRRGIAPDVVIIAVGEVGRAVLDLSRPRIVSEVVLEIVLRDVQASRGATGDGALIGPREAGGVPGEGVCERVLERILPVDPVLVLVIARQLMATQPFEKAVFLRREVELVDHLGAVRGPFRRLPGGAGADRCRYRASGRRDSACRPN